MAEFQTREALADQGILKILETEHDVHGFNDMPAGILRAFMGMWGLLLVTLWVFFAGDGAAAFAVAISSGFVFVFFAVPLLMVRQINSVSRREDVFKTCTGPMSTRAAATQVLLIPSALTLALLSIGIIKLFVPLG